MKDMDFRRFRRVLCFFLVFPVFLGFPPFLFARNVSDIVGDTFEEVEGRGLLIRTSPTGARVFVDGVERGQTPFAMDNIRSGDYRIRLIKDGYRERRFMVTISSESRMVVSIELEEARGQVLLRLQKGEGSPPAELLPFNPVLSAGGETAAIYPQAGEPVFLSLPVGYRTIQARAFGWEDALRTVYVREEVMTSVTLVMNPAPFALSHGSVSRSRFNPANAGSLGHTEFRFEVSAPGTGTLTVKDQNGTVVYRTALGPFRTWSQSVTWNGRGRNGDPLPGGIFQVFIETESVSWDDSAPVSQVLSLETEIDPSLAIYPLSLQSVFAGLLFAPAPASLPRGSFQIEAGLFFGKTAPAERAFSGLPFDTGIRFSPLDRGEFTVLLNAQPKFGDTAAWGAAGSFKYVFIHSDEGAYPLGCAAGLSYAWAENGAAPIGPGTGMGFSFPLSWRFNALTLVFSPGIQWPLPHDLVVRPVLAGGFYYRGSWFIAGFSLRQEYNLSKNLESGRDERNRSPAFLQAGGEIKFYPPPSNLVFSLSGGLWHTGSETGGFGGLGIGLIY
jgi:hypothetical protein